MAVPMDMKVPNVPPPWIITLVKDDINSRPRNPMLEHERLQLVLGFKLSQDSANLPQCSESAEQSTWCKTNTCTHHEAVLDLFPARGLLLTAVHVLDWWHFVRSQVLIRVREKTMSETRWNGTRNVPNFILRRRSVYRKVTETPAEKYHWKSHVCCSQMMWYRFWR